jgi:hypothetical protein
MPDVATLWMIGFWWWVVSTLCVLLEHFFISGWKPWFEPFAQVFAGGLYLYAFVVIVYTVLADPELRQGFLVYIVACGVLFGSFWLMGQGFRAVRRYLRSPRAPKAGR